jgi:hypothetical protein
MTSRGLLAGLLDRELTGNKREQQQVEHQQETSEGVETSRVTLVAGSSVPSSFNHAFSCSGRHAGTIQVDPDGDPCPPYAIAYNQVSSTRSWCNCCSCQ